MKKETGLFVVFTLCISLLAGCGVSDISTASSSEISETGSASSGGDTIKIAVYPLPSPYFFYALDEMNEFEKYGVNAELVSFAQYSDAIQALDSGSVDGAIMGITEAVSPIVNDLGLQVVMVSDYSYGMDGIVVKSDVESAEELKGKTIATNVGTMNHMLLLDYLNDNKMTADDVNIVNMSEVDATASFISGSIDAASIFDPQMTKAVEEGDGKIIYSSKDCEGELADVLLVNKKIIDSKSDQVQGIINAWFDVQSQFEKDSDSISKMIGEDADISADEFKKLLEGIQMASVNYNKEIFADDGAELHDLIIKVANFLYDTNCIEKLPSDDQVNNAIDGSFVNNLS